MVECTGVRGSSEGDSGGGGVCVWVLGLGGGTEFALRALGGRGEGEGEVIFNFPG